MRSDDLLITKHDLTNIMGRLHPSFQRFFSMTRISHVDWEVAFFSMTRINHVDWAVGCSDGYTRPGLLPGALQSWQLHHRRPRGRRCGRLWPDPRHGYLWEPLSTPGHLTSPASWQMSATAIPALSSNCASPGRFSEVSQRLSFDHLVLELEEGERGFGDVGDPARAGGDNLQVVQRWVSSAKPRSPRPRSDRIRIPRQENGLPQDVGSGG